MPSTPTSKSQVQAYRFVLRRMESALVRKDPVMLHDPMRGHKRATIVGIILGVVGLAGFAIFGLFKQDPTVPDSGIIVSQPSGQIYVVSQQPRQIIPVFNMASARLLAYAESQKSNQNSGGQQQQQASQQAPAVPATTTVADTALTSFPMGRLTGIPDGPQVLPQPGTTATTTNWNICDDIPRTDAPSPTQGQQPDTVVTAGITDIGQDLQGNQALLVTGRDKNDYLIFQKQHNLNNEDDSTVRAQVDMKDPAVKTALGLNTIQPRPISDALLNAIPEVGEISNPVKDVDAGRSVPNSPQPSGHAYQVNFASGAKYYLMLSDGYQQVSQTVAQIVQSETKGEGALPQVPASTQSTIAATQHPVDTSQYPGQPPGVFTADARNVICLGWSEGSNGPGTTIAKTRVTVDTQLHLPADQTSATGQMQYVKIGQANPSGDRITGFFLNPQYPGLAVHSVTSASDLNAGQIYIISGRGIKYSVPDVQTAQALGVASNAGPAYGMVPAPASIIGLLPVSAQTLSTQNVLHTFDTLPEPENAGAYTSVNQAPSGN
jgi:type VII secretion protein EccB